MRADVLFPPPVYPEPPLTAVAAPVTPFRYRRPRPVPHGVDSVRVPHATRRRVSDPLMRRLQAPGR